MDSNGIDALKGHPTQGATLTYKLKNANVHVSAKGFHFIDYLDPISELSPEIDASKLTKEESAYIETQLQANLKKFKNQASIGYRMRRRIVSVFAQAGRRASGGH
jgi:hypothetical protein